MGFHASRAIAALLLAALSIAATPRGASAVVQCGQVTQLMAPCMPYLGGAPGMTPYGICCNSLGVLNQLAATTADRVATCNCVKAAAATGFPSVDFGRAASLPGACGLSINFVVTPNMDCNQYVLRVDMHRMHLNFLTMDVNVKINLFFRSLRRRRRCISCRVTDEP
jgi:hypothetical protein